MNMVKLSLQIQHFKPIGGDPLHKTWLRFKNFFNVQRMEFQKFAIALSFWSLDSINKFVADQLVDGLRRQLYDVASLLLDDMTKFN